MASLGLMGSPSELGRLAMPINFLARARFKLGTSGPRVKRSVVTPQWRGQEVVRTNIGASRVHKGFHHESLVCGQVRSGMGAYAGAARRRVHLATILLRPPSGHRPGRRQARILQMGLHLTQPRSVWVPLRHGPAPRISTEKVSDERDPPQEVAPHAHRGVIGAPGLVCSPIG